MGLTFCTVQKALNFEHESGQNKPLKKKKMRFSGSKKSNYSTNYNEMSPYIRNYNKKKKEGKRQNKITLSQCNPERKRLC